MSATKTKTAAKPAARPQAWVARTTREAREAAAWIEGTNPLRGMTAQRAQALFDAARAGDTIHLQWLYNEIESVDPTLLVCAERRSGAMVTPDWTIRKRNPRRVRGWDEGLAEEQAALLEAEYGRADAANLNTALEHLSQAFFRGFAHVAPLYTADGLGLAGFDILPAWCFRRDMGTGGWLWDPAGRAYAAAVGLEPIPAEELASVVRTRHIDYPALAIYLRSAVGEKCWGQFMERYGLPPVTIIMPPNIPDNLLQTYLAAAEKVAKGGTGALPNGSSVSYATEARGTDPFSLYLDHQQKLVVLMATGGLATSLEAVSGLNGDVGGAHQATWHEIWRRDSVVVADSLNRSPTRLLLERNFPGRPHLAYFAFDTEPARGPGSIFEDAGKARTAGYTIRQEQLEEKTGYTLTPYEAPAATGIAPASPWQSGDQAADPAVEVEVQSAALNGAQIQSIVSVIADAAAGKIPKDSVLPTFKIAFPTIPEEQLGELVGSLAGFKPAEGSVLNSRDPEADGEAGQPRKPVAKPLQNARTAEDGKTPAETETPPQIASDAVLEEVASAMRESLAEAMARAAAGEEDGNLKLETGNLETKPDKEDA